MLWCMRADQAECLNRSVQTGLIRSLIWPHKFPTPACHACTGITGLSGIKPLNQNTHGFILNVRADDFTAFLLCFSPHNAASEPTAGALIPCTSGFVLIRTCSPGRICWLCNSPLHYSHVQCPNKITDRLTALCPNPLWHWWSQPIAK